jgi:predicted ABC-type ATPase
MMIANPNGSGKSAFRQCVDFEARERLLDTDAIARDLDPLNPSAEAIAAGRGVLKRTADYLNRGVSFAIETTLSGRGKLELIREAKSRGYKIYLVFIGLNSAELCILRIRKRAAQGGHFIPEADASCRYARSTVKAGCVAWQATPLREWVTI